MKRPASWAAILAAGFLASWFLTEAGRTGAADDYDPREPVVKLASALEKKDKDAKEQAKKGLGVGLKAGVVMPDGIEKKIEVLADKPLAAKALGDESESLQQMGYAMAAIAEVSLAKPPEKDVGKKKVKDWVKWSEDLRDASLQLAEAAKKKDAAALQKATDKANTACNRCHDVFRE
jgi:Cytochrome C'